MEAIKKELIDRVVAQKPVFTISFCPNYGIDIKPPNFIPSSMTKEDLNAIRNLRELTGSGMMDCKKAYFECDKNISNAVLLIRSRGLLTRI